MKKLAFLFFLVTLTLLTAISVNAAYKPAALISSSQFYMDDDGFLHGIAPETTVDQLKAEFQNDIIIKTSANKTVTTGVVGAGYKLYSSSGAYMMTVIVDGDINGNGKMDSNDTLLMRSVFLGTNTNVKYAAPSVNFYAADTNLNGKIDSNDYIQVRRVILNQSASVYRARPASIPDEQPPVSPDDQISSLTYVFTGEDAMRPGYAEGTVTIVPGDQGAAKGYYVMYFANDDRILPDYKAIAAIPVTGKTVTFDMVRKMAIPEGATQIAVFESTSVTPAVTSLSFAKKVTIPQAKRFNSGAAEYRFASLSDIHVNYSYAADKWTRALNYFDSIGLDLVCISGDYTDSGSSSQFTTYINGIKNSTYKGQIWASIGNHDTANKTNYLNYLSNQGNDGQNLYFHKIAPNGDVFIFMAQDTLSQTGNTHVENNFSNEQMDWLEGLLRQYSGTGVNIFVYEHAAFLNWGPGDAIPGVYVQPMNVRPQYPNVMRFKALLDEYKEVVWCSGHTHVAFSEMVNFSDNNGTTARMIHNSSVSQIRTYNSTKTKLIYDTNSVDSEGYITTVYANDIVFRGMDLATHKYLPTACYIMECMNNDHASTRDVDSLAVNPGSTIFFPAGSSLKEGDIKLDVTYTDGSEETITTGFNVTIYGDSYSISPDQSQFRTTDNKVMLSYGGKYIMMDITVR